MEGAEIKERLRRLYPGENAERKYHDYKVKKGILMLIVVILGILSAICLQLCSRRQDGLTDGRYSDGDKQGKGSNSVTLSVQEDSGVGETKRKSAAVLFWGFSGAFLTAFGMDADLKKKDKKRREEISLSYSGFVSRLRLYMGAGLTVKNAFLKIGEDYKKEKEKNGKLRYLYEEVLICGYYFLNGGGEDQAYHEWGKRCDEANCRKLGFLLSAHVRQGNEKLLSMLSEEMNRALAEKKSQAKKQGEEAGTKLLFPMVLMLVEVLLLILLPAFVGFGGM